MTILNLLSQFGKILLKKGESGIVGTLSECRAGYGRLVSIGSVSSVPTKKKASTYLSTQPL